MVQLMMLGALAVLLLAAAVAAPPRHPCAAGSSVRLVLVVGLPVVVGTVVGSLWPAVEDALRVDPDAVRGGEVWRLVTASAVQEPGAFGAVFNLVLLALAIPFVARVFPTGRALAVFWGSAAVLNGIAVVSGTTVAGSSGATFALLGCVAAWGMLRGSSPVWPAPAAVVLAGVVWALGDWHGMATVLGAAAGALLALVGRRRVRRSRV